MDINIKTKFNIGDTVWAFLLIWNAENIYNDMDCQMKLYKKKISAIRYYISQDKTQIQYFLEGLHSYEGENWFDEPEDNKCLPAYLNECIFANEKDAYKAYNHYKFLTACDSVTNSIEKFLNNPGNEYIK